MRTNSQWYQNIVLIALALFTILAAGCAEVEPPTEHSIEVRDAKTSDIISNARVTGEVGLRHIVTDSTDVGGTVTLAFAPEHLALHQWVKITAEADGYPAQSVLINLENSKSPTVIRLAAEGEVSTSTEMPADEPPTVADTADEQTATNDNSGPDTILTASTVSTAKVDPGASEPGSLANLPAEERANYYTARPAMTINQEKSYQATIVTNKGDIVVSLDASAAPEHVNNFIFLGNEGFYDGLTFHRVEPDFVIQGGDPLGDGQGGPGYTVPGEFSLKHGEGALAMARLPDQVNPDRESSGSQFYITLAPTPFLDGQYSVFGKVESGLDVVKSIEVGDTIERVIIQP